MANQSPKIKGKLTSLLGCKCPKCRTGKVFKYSILNPLKFAEMHKDCPHCGHHFEIEPGYFYTAMYISYMISSGGLITIGGATYFLLNDPDLWVYATVIIGSMTLLSPFSLRYSRMLTMYLVTPIKYNPSLGE